MTRGCPVATVALEASAESPQVRTACDDAYRSWLRQLTTKFEEWGVTRAEQRAVAALSMLEGALLLCRVQRGLTPLQTVADQLVELLTAARTEES
ncbi:hypothetical protein [Saccharopolyspora thermophila]|uniref:LmrA/YxaF family transcription factor n=1 Tax=Saccharopolyspora thermophila TaxID=89367 RepID=UPI00357152E6